MKFICGYLKKLKILVEGEDIIKNVVLEKKEVGIAWMLASVRKLGGIRNRTDKERCPT